MAAPLNHSKKAPNPTKLKESLPEQKPQDENPKKSSNEPEQVKLSQEDALCFEQKEVVYDNLMKQINVISDAFAKDPRFNAFGGLSIAAVADAVWELAGRVLKMANPDNKDECLKQYDAMAASMRHFVAATYDMEKADAAAQQQSDADTNKANG